MKKSLIALAVLAASGASFAQSSVTVYGIADIWFGSIKAPDEVTGKSVTKTVLNSGGVSTSRWGLKGTEDLGGGLKANFLLEKGILLDSGAEKGNGFDRQSYVGFSGGFGEIKLGNVYTAYDDINGAANSAFDSALAPTAHGAAAVSDSYNYSPRNNIYYASPNMGGFSGAFSYGLGENNTPSLSASSVTSLHVKYEGGPLYVGFGYQNETPQGGGDSAAFKRLNATYDFGVAKLLAGWAKVDEGQASITDYQIGVDVPLSAALAVSAGYARSSDNSFLGDGERTGLGLALSYTMSKRTSVYGGLHRTTTKDNGEADVNIFAVGVRHAF